MTNEMIQKAIEEATFASEMGYTAWLMSNGKELIVAWTNLDKERNQKHGFWIAGLYEHGHRIDL